MHTVNMNEISFVGPIYTVRGALSSALINTLVSNPRVPAVKISFRGSEPVLYGASCKNENRFKRNV